MHSLRYNETCVIAAVTGRKMTTAPKKREALIRKSVRKALAKPTRPADLPHGRWLGDLEREKPLSDAERALVKACAMGKSWAPVNWNGDRPEEQSPENCIRAELIRFLLLGGDCHNPVHEKGVTARGAYVAGILDLYQACCAGRLSLARCKFECAPDFRGATLPELGLNGTATPGLKGDRLTVLGGVFLRNEFFSTGEVRLLRANIGGTLSCRSSYFFNQNGCSINADGLIAKGGIFFNRGFISKGEVRLIGAETGGNLTCVGGTFLNTSSDALCADGLIARGDVVLSDDFTAEGEVRLIGALIEGDLNLSNGVFKNEMADAVTASRMVVKGGLFLNDAKIQGAVNFEAARVSSLIDGNFSWAEGRHYFDGFQYERLVVLTDAESRIAWLKRQVDENLKEDFRPQPWEQLIKVLRDMGHSYEASEVAIAKQVALREAGKITGIRKVLHVIYGALAGYGYRPMRTVGWMCAVWFVLSFAYWAGADYYSAIGPADPVITSEVLYGDASRICGHGNEAGKTRWTECPGVPDEYSTFQPFMYSLDLILPLVDLQQDSDWAPIAEGPTGHDLLAGAVLRWFMWFEILFGWTASLILVAVLGRLVEMD